MTNRFVFRPDRDGFRVHDLLTGQPAMLASTPQIGLSQADAAHTADLLNRHASEAGRQVSQTG
jgi:hypothetical protein